MKLAVFETGADMAQAFGNLCPALECRCTAQPLDTGNVGDYRDAEIVSVGESSRLTFPVLVQLPNAALIIVRSSGNPMDLAFCARAGIAVVELAADSDAMAAHHVDAVLSAVRQLRGARG
ncbi:hypothetical protein ACFQ1E_14035 [Sphingomonas canadensis]|uniref:D-isomer specific 2-hydroxyacid dehydrogenase catalytic domain-containing protein n=1 Tax=Sphingomonas canadensis TaxID=1219257 RepID=A0ABW3HCT6_9SPHN|nr:hypothetical protein [Sphingomonas canadensis]MCW3837296.1 hypothetical protein [Sphingomonas canadensis]